MQIRTRRQQIQELEEQNRYLTQIQELQSEQVRLVQTQELLVDNLLSVIEDDAAYTGNRYRTYSQAVVELAKKYAGNADWGVLQAGNIIDLRASYIAGQGIKVNKVIPDEPDEATEAAAQAAYDFAVRFIDKNELDHELVQDLAREAEIEGKTLVKLFPKKAEDGETDIVLRWISWVTNKYKVNVSTADYLQLESVTWEPSVKLEPAECVYKRFAGRLDIPNETMPRTGKCLTQIENLDIALRDWRKINHLYAAPTPHIECATADDARVMSEAMSGLNWKIGKVFAHTGTFGYAQPSAEGQQALEAEIITLMKLISGTTGVPIHFLGAPELTTKYGAANEGLLELIAMSTSKERDIWRAAYQEMLDKAMRMWNAETKMTPLRPELVRVDLPIITAEQWERITATWLMLYNSSAITRKTLLTQVPGLDVDKELQELEKADAENLKRFNEEKVDEEEDEDDEGAEE